MKKEENMEEIRNRIAELESRLSANNSPIGDYKIIKIYEARLKGEKDPYDAARLIKERDEARKEINQLQKKLV